MVRKCTATFRSHRENTVYILIKEINYLDKKIYNMTRKLNLSLASQNSEICSLQAIPFSARFSLCFDCGNGKVLFELRFDCGNGKVLIELCFDCDKVLIELRFDSGKVLIQCVLIVVKCWLSYVLTVVKYRLSYVLTVVKYWLSAFCLL